MNVDDYDGFMGGRLLKWHAFFTGWSHRNFVKQITALHGAFNPARARARVCVFFRCHAHCSPPFTQISISMKTAFWCSYWLTTLSARQKKWQPREEMEKKNDHFREDARALAGHQKSFFETARERKILAKTIFKKSILWIFNAFFTLSALTHMQLQSQALRTMLETKKMERNLHNETGMMTATKTKQTKNAMQKARLRQWHERKNKQECALEKSCIYSVLSARVCLYTMHSYLNVHCISSSSRHFNISLHINMHLVRSSSLAARELIHFSSKRSRSHTHRLETVCYKCKHNKCINAVQIQNIYFARRYLAQPNKTYSLGI